MIQTKCDRCGKILPYDIPLLQAKYPIVSIMITHNLHDTYHSIDFCDECRREFLRWVKGGETDMETDEGGADDCQTIELTEKLQNRINQAANDIVEKMSKAANPTRYFQKSDWETDDEPRV